MKYIICDKVVASNYGFSPITHRVLGTLIILNEKEVTFCTAIEGDTLEEKAATIAGTVMTEGEVMDLTNNVTITEYGWFFSKRFECNLTYH